MSEPGTQDQADDAWWDLAVKQVTEGLSPEEERAFAAMDGATTGEALRGLEQAAAAVTLAADLGAPPLPAALRARLEQDAAQFVSSRGIAAAPVAVLQPPAPRRRGSPAPAWLAAAACLLLALFAWFHPGPPAQPPAPPTAEAARLALLARSDTLKIALKPTEDPGAAGVTGDAVWDPVAQRGFLHFVGLVANDPAVRQYQIWIFDGSRDKRYPVDGGVFDVPANNREVVIPIRAGLPIRQLKAFAVTAEQPGGVVVSGLEHVLVLGSAG